MTEATGTDATDQAIPADAQAICAFMVAKAITKMRETLGALRDAMPDEVPVDTLDALGAATASLAALEKLTNRDMEANAGALGEMIARSLTRGRR